MNDNHSIHSQLASEAASEFQLVARAQRGEEAAFEALYDLHSQRVFSFCLSIADERKEAEELARGIFLKVFRSLSTFRQDGEFAHALDKEMLQTAISIRKGHRISILQRGEVGRDKAEASADKAAEAGARKGSWTQPKERFLMQALGIDAGPCFWN
jgi:DNA-directed RNA polymerase specialized sigma24 family protein